jgi:hypothetical protein
MLSAVGVKEEHPLVITSMIARMENNFRVGFIKIMVSSYSYKKPHGTGGVGSPKSHSGSTW